MFIRTELATVLEKAQRQFKGEAGESFIDEASIVIDGFIEEELLGKIDIMEECISRFFTPLQTDRCTKCAAELASDTLEFSKNVEAPEQLGCPACLSQVVTIPGLVAAKFEAPLTKAAQEPITLDSRE